MVKLGFSKGMKNSNLYFKEFENGLLIVVVFVDNIIFGGNDEASDKFVDEIKNEFEMSMIGEMKLYQVYKLYKTVMVFSYHKKIIQKNY